MVKKAISFMSAFVLLLTLLAGVMLPAGASEYDDINDDAVFLKQQSSVTCTLVSNVMMFRRRAILDGNSNWSSITEASVKPTAWTSGGMRWDVTYSGMRTVTYGMIVREIWPESGSSSLISCKHTPKELSFTAIRPPVVSMRFC